MTGAILTVDRMQRMWPHGDQRVSGLIAGLVASAPGLFDRFGLTAPLVIAHAMAQFSHECGAGVEMVENMNYSAERLPQVWPKHFNARNAAAYAHNPQKLGDYIYGPELHPDLGNGPNEGYKFRGRGFAQTTGHAAYALLSRRTGLDLLTNPDLVNDPVHALECGLTDWIACGCLPHAQADDIVKETKALNGGLIGLPERRVWLARWKRELSVG